MDNKMMMDPLNPLHKVQASDFPSQPLLVRMGARFISYLFHPAFVPVFIVWYLLYSHPYAFAGFNGLEKTKVLIQAFIMYTFFPLVTVLLLKALKFIQTFRLNTQKDRIIPLVACGIWYFWIWYVWRNLPDYPVISIQLALSIWISVSLALMANIVMKISLHAIAMGVMASFLLILGLMESNGLPMTIGILLTGLVCTARLIDSDHSNREIYSGLFIGLLSQVIAWWAV